MKTIAVSIKLEMEVPDHWELMKSADGVEVLKMGNDGYLDLTFEPLVAADIEGTWTNDVDEQFMNGLLDMVVLEDVTYEVVLPITH